MPCLARATTAGFSRHSFQMWAHTCDRSKINNNIQVLTIFRQHGQKGRSLAWALCPHSGRALSRGNVARPSPDKRVSAHSGHDRSRGRSRHALPRQRAQPNPARALMPFPATSHYDYAFPRRELRVTPLTRITPSDLGATALSSFAQHAHVRRRMCAGCRRRRLRGKPAMPAPPLRSGPSGASGV
jgi:hypothetical protein